MNNGERMPEGAPNNQYPPDAFMRNGHLIRLDEHGNVEILRYPEQPQQQQQPAEMPQSYLGAEAPPYTHATFNVQIQGVARLDQLANIGLPGLSAYAQNANTPMPYQYPQPPQQYVHPMQYTGVNEPMSGYTPEPTLPPEPTLLPAPQPTAEEPEKPGLTPPPAPRSDANFNYIPLGGNTGKKGRKKAKGEITPDDTPRVSKKTVFGAAVLSAALVAGPVIQAFSAGEEAVAECAAKGIFNAPGCYFNEFGSVLTGNTFNIFPTAENE